MSRMSIGAGPLLAAVVVALSLAGATPAGAEQEEVEQQPLPPEAEPAEAAADGGDPEPATPEPEPEAAAEPEPEAAAEPEPEAAAEPGDGGGEEDGGEPEEPAPRTYGHRMQGGIGIMVGTGYYFEIAYQSRTDSPNRCRSAGSTEAASSCSGRSPLYIDFQAAFGVTDGLEVLAEFRLGLLEDYLPTFEDGTVAPEPSRPFALGVGVRYFTDPLSWFKFFVGALLDIDLTPRVEVDVTVRPIVGIQLDFMRWGGFFVQVAPTISFIRSLRFAFDGGAGLQFRFP